MTRRRRRLAGARLRGPHRHDPVRRPRAGPHRRRRRRLRRLQHAGVRRRLPGQAVRADGRRRDPLQLRAVLRVRHVLPRLQPRGGDLVVVPRGRARGGVPAIVIGVCWKWVAAGDDERWAGVSESDRAALEVALGLAAATGDDGHRRHRRRSGRRGRAARGAGRRRDPGRARRCAGGPRAAPRSPHALAAVARRRRRGSCAATCRPTVAAGPCRRSSPPSSARRRRSGCVGGRARRRRCGCACAPRAVSTVVGARCSRVAAPAVLSVEGAVARLRRASLPAELAARTGRDRRRAGPDAARSSTPTPCSATGREPGCCRRRRAPR